MTRFVLVAASLLVLSACGSERSGTVETDDGDVDYSVDTSTGDATVTLNTEEGEVQITGGSGLTSDFPAGYSQFPGSDVINSSNVSHADGAAARIAMNSTDSVDDIVAYYRRQAEARGVAISTEVNAGGQRMISGESPDGEVFSLTVGEGAGVNSISLIVSSGM